jgi:hypothetical protein
MKEKIWQVAILVGCVAFAIGLLIGTAFAAEVKYITESELKTLLAEEPQKVGYPNKPNTKTLFQLMPSPGGDQKLSKLYLLRYPNYTRMSTGNDKWLTDILIAINTEGKIVVSFVGISWDENQKDNELYRSFKADADALVQRINALNDNTECPGFVGVYSINDNWGNLSKPYDRGKWWNDKKWIKKLEYSAKYNAWRIKSKYAHTLEKWQKFNVVRDFGRPPTGHPYIARADWAWATLWPGLHAVSEVCDEYSFIILGKKDKVTDNLCDIIDDFREIDRNRIGETSDLYKYNTIPPFYGVEMLFLASDGRFVTVNTFPEQLARFYYDAKSLKVSADTYLQGNLMEKTWAASFFEDLFNQNVKMSEVFLQKWLVGGHVAGMDLDGAPMLVRLSKECDPKYYKNNRTD